MALSQPHANYTTALNNASSAGLDEDYLMILEYKTSSSSGKVGLSMDYSGNITDDEDSSGTTVSFTPCITSSPSIREKINIKNYTSSIGNVTVNIVDFENSVSTFSLSNDNGRFSGEFPKSSGGRVYINGKVRIFSKASTDTQTARFLKVFEGRLGSVEANFIAKTMSIKLNAYNPFKDILLPLTRDTELGIPAPISYGDYTPNATGAYTASSNFFEMPVHSISGGFLQGVARDIAIGSESVAHIFDDGSDSFIPLHHITSSDSGLASTVSTLGVHLTKSSTSIVRTVKYKPSSIDTDTDNTGSSWSNTANIMDSPTADDSSDFGSTTKTATINSGSGDDFSAVFNSDPITFNTPPIIGTVNAYAVTIVYKIAQVGDTSTIAGTHNLDMSLTKDASGNVTYGNSFANNGSNRPNGFTADTTNLADDATSSLLTHTITFNSTDIAGDIPDFLSFRLSSTIEQDNATSNRDHTVQFQIFDVRIVVSQKAKVSGDNNQSGKREVLSIDNLYNGANGYTASWDSSAITNIVDMHRDFLHRFGGLATSVTPTNYSSIKSARSNFAIRYHFYEPRTLQSVLDKIQFEGAFIFRINSQGSYVYINPDAPSAITSTSTGNLTFSTSDVANVNFKLMPLQDLSTSHKLFYDLHPAKKTYRETLSRTASDRTILNFSTTQDNQQTFEFDTLTSSAGVIDWSNKYFNKFATVENKIFVSMEITNPKFFYLEVGDVFNFNSSMGYAFDTDLDHEDTGFIVLETQRSLGKLKVTAFNIGVES
tara:strand:+ start:1835 stop:4141 length:2307 start_codon:yes stop_codon:yes gene_type:complete